MKPQTEALRQALSLFYFLQGARGGRTAREIAEHLNIGTWHVHRLMAAAEIAGWPLVREEDRTEGREFRWKLAR